MVAVLKDALEDFTDALAEMQNVAAELSALPDSQAKERHVMRLQWANNQVATVQTIAVQITMAMAGTKRTTKIKLPRYAEDIALSALKGGTAILAGVTYAAKQFIHAQQNPGQPPLALGLAAGLNWAGLGTLLDSIEGMRK